MLLNIQELMFFLVGSPSNPTQLFCGTGYHLGSHMKQLMQVIASCNPNVTPKTTKANKLQRQERPFQEIIAHRPIMSHIPVVARKCLWNLVFRLASKEVRQEKKSLEDKTSGMSSRLQFWRPQCFVLIRGLL